MVEFNPLGSLSGLPHVCWKTFGAERRPKVVCLGQRRNSREVRHTAFSTAHPWTSWLKVSRSSDGLRNPEPHVHNQCRLYRVKKPKAQKGL